MGDDLVKEFGGGRSKRGEGLAVGWVLLVEVPMSSIGLVRGDSCVFGIVRWLLGRAERKITGLYVISIQVCSVL